MIKIRMTRPCNLGKLNKKLDCSTLFIFLEIDFEKTHRRLLRQDNFFKYFFDWNLKLEKFDSYKKNYGGGNC